ncbi:MAG: hypothetical protein GY952_08035, partial [Rhodobacteraceae bacterium]|nr:hypothetical protein [Paracoccaceae bacterium]
VSGTAVELSDVQMSSNTSGFVINGVSADDRSGFSVSSAGDVNGDGLDDLIVGAHGDDPNGYDSGASFVVYGKTSGASIELSDVEAGIGGFVINGVSADDYSGVSVSSAGDVNGDGFDDLIVGAWRDDPNGNNSGASFVIYGGDFTGAATQVGTSAGEAHNGTGANDVIFAGGGDDTLDGNGGTDRLSGAQGADTFKLDDDPGLSTTTIIDFSSSEGDKLDVSSFGIASFAAFELLLGAHGPGGHNTLIHLPGDTFAVLIGVEPTDLAAGDVLL